MGTKPWVSSLFEKKKSIKRSLLARCVSEVVLKVGYIFGTCFFLFSSFERILGPKIGMVVGVHCLKSRIGVCKASLGHPILLG